MSKTTLEGLDYLKPITTERFPPWLVFPNRHHECPNEKLVPILSKYEFIAHAGTYHSYTFLPNGNLEIESVTDHYYLFTWKEVARAFVFVNFMETYPTSKDGEWKTGKSRYGLEKIEGCRTVEELHGMNGWFNGLDDIDSVEEFITLCRLAVL